MSHRPFLVVISSPSGAGKTSICRGVVRRDRRVAYSVSATTRPRRQGEADGRSYRFLSERAFQALARRNALLEQARVYGHSYGTPRAPVLAHFRAGRDVIADLDIQGMRSCRRVLPGTVSIFIIAPRPAEYARRLRGRGTDSAEVLSHRQARLEAELAAIPDFDYLVVNDRLDRAIDQVLAIIRGERQRTGRLAQPVTTGSKRRQSKGV